VEVEDKKLVVQTLFGKNESIW